MSPVEHAGTQLDDSPAGALSTETCPAHLGCLARIKRPQLLIWISTVPLNKSMPKGKAMGLPSVEATDEEVYETASKLSRVRESISIPSDGVYCPVCHIANIQLAKLGTPCPK